MRKKKRVWYTPLRTRVEQALVALLAIIACIGFGVLVGRLFTPEPEVEPDAPPVMLLSCVEPEPDIEPQAVQEPPPAPAYTEQELEVLAMIIYQEAGGDAASDETRLMVGNVVLNRVADGRFPDNIVEVVLQRGQYGRLHQTGIKWPDRSSAPGEAHAVARAYTLAERLLEGERVLPEDVIWQAEFPQGTETVAHQDGIYFCR